jgi:hypothetical protein
MRLDSAFLDSQSLLGDPPADELIAELVERQAISSAIPIIHDIVHSGGTSHPELDLAWRALVKSEDIGPIDWGKVERAEQLFRVWGPQICLSLCAGSLAGGYAAFRVAHLLHGVSRLESDPGRRVFETTQMVFDVLSGEGLRPQGRGLETVNRVRLMHAAVRRLLLEYSQQHQMVDIYSPLGHLVWHRGWGVPINQELMIETIMTFSVQVIQCLHRLGARLKRSDQWAYVYTWLVVARLMGVQPQLIPENLDEALALWEKTKERQFQASQAGAELEATLLAALTSLVPGRGLRYLPRALVWWLNGQEAAEMVGLPPLRLHERLGFFWWLAGERAVASLEVHSGFARRHLGSASMTMVRRLQDRELAHQRPQFSIPQSLAGEWGITSVGGG